MIMYGLWRPGEGIGSPRTGGVDSYEPLDAGAGNQTWVLFKNSVDLNPELSPLTQYVALSRGFWALNSGLHACVAST